VPGCPPLAAPGACDPIGRAELTLSASALITIWRLTAATIPTTRNRRHRPGDRVTLTVVRDGREQQLTATLADNPNG
jgi:hypothetical protein